MSQGVPQRGHIYRIDVGQEDTLLALVLSVRAVHEVQSDCITLLVVRDRTPVRLPYWVRLGAGDPSFGYVVCRDIGMVGREDLKEDLGELSGETMREVERALKMVLGL